MDPVNETKKRLKIAERISSSLEGIAKEVLLGGSMGFGQNYSVTDKSDVDLVVVVDGSNINQLKSSWYFKGQTVPEFTELLKTQQATVFWVTRNIDGIETNAFVYETEGYVDFCLLKGGLRSIVQRKPREVQKAYGFDGQEFTFHRNVTPYKNLGFSYEKPALIDGKCWMGVPRQDFLYSGCIL